MTYIDDRWSPDNGELTNHLIAMVDTDDQIGMQALLDLPGWYPVGLIRQTHTTAPDGTDVIEDVDITVKDLMRALKLRKVTGPIVVSILGQRGMLRPREH